ncbi:MAG: phosphatase PAP2 family protein [Clostridia bacterium]|nr:phosphatase PAP2 family protein [Clostridia bacterium]
MLQLQRFFEILAPRCNMDKKWKISKRQWILMAYLPIHIALFFIFEHVNYSHFTVIHCALDDMIPFCEWFIIPYLLWFPYMVAAGLYFLRYDNKSFDNYALSLFTGFFIGIVYIAFNPTVQNLRPQDLQNGEGIDNIAKWLVSYIYHADTNTGVFPSLHAVGAICVAVNVARAPKLKKKVWLQIASWLLCILILLATMFAKQHSALDVGAGLALEAVVLVVVFTGLPSKLVDKITKTRITEDNEIVTQL